MYTKEFCSFSIQKIMPDKSDFLHLLESKDPVLTPEDISYGFTLFSEDSAGGLLYIKQYSMFSYLLGQCGTLPEFTRLHEINLKYICRLEKSPLDNQRTLSFLYLKEAEYYLGTNTYSECMRTLFKLFDLKELEPSYRHILYALFVTIFTGCKLSEQTKWLFPIVEAVRDDEDVTPLTRFITTCNLLSCAINLKDREKVHEYILKVKKLFDSVPDYMQRFANIYILQSEAAFAGAGTIPSAEYIENVHKYILDCNSECTDKPTQRATVNESDSQTYLDILRYIKPAVSDHEMVEIASRLIDDFEVIPDKLDIYSFLFDECRISPSLNSELYENYFNALHEYYRLDREARRNVVLSEIQAHKLEKEYRINAETDELTRLGNRLAYNKKLQEIASCNTLPDDLCILMIDVNGLKEANDTYGHASGDELLLNVAYRVASIIGKYGRLYRIGGDEFSAILNLPCEQAFSITAELNRPHAGGSLSAGCAVPSDLDPGIESEKRLHELLRMADERMYSAKRKFYEAKGNDRRR